MQNLNQKGIAAIIIILIIVLLLAIGIWLGLKFYNQSKNQNQQSENQKIELTLDESNNGETIDLSQGDKFKIVLSDPGDGGYDFDKPQYDKSIIKQVDYQNISPMSEADGDFGSDEWTFEVIKSGQTNLKYEIYRTWDQEGRITALEVDIKVK